MQMVETTSVNPIQEQKSRKVRSIRITDNIFFCIATKMEGQNWSNEIVDIKSKKMIKRTDAHGAGTVKWGMKEIIKPQCEELHMDVRWNWLPRQPTLKW